MDRWMMVINQQKKGMERKTKINQKKKKKKKLLSLAQRKHMSPFPLLIIYKCWDKKKKNKTQIRLWSIWFQCRTIEFKYWFSLHGKFVSFCSSLFNYILSLQNIYKDNMSDHVLLLASKMNFNTMNDIKGRLNETLWIS